MSYKKKSRHWGIKRFNYFGKLVEQHGSNQALKSITQEEEWKLGNKKVQPFW